MNLPDSETTDLAAAQRFPKVEAERRLGLRAVVIGLLLMPLNSLWVAYMEAIKYSGHPTTYSLYFNTVFILLILTWLNAALRKFAPRLSLSQTELLVIYFMLSVASALVGHDQAQVLLSVIGYPKYFSTPENRWGALFGAYLPRHLIVSDPIALRELYDGRTTLWTHGHLLAWGLPLLWWGGFTTALLLVMLGACVLLRKQWTENEKLSFPLVTLPIQMTEPSLAFYRSRLMWWAFLVPAAINTLNSLQAIYPNLPAFPTRRVDFGQFVTSPPWNAIGWTPLWLFPFAIGIGFLLPTEVLFSAGFFYWFWKLEWILCAGSGLEIGQNLPPYEAEQSFGAYAGVAVFVLWAARKHLKEAVRQALRRGDESSPDASTYRIAFLCLVLGFVSLVWFGTSGATLPDGGLQKGGTFLRPDPKWGMGMLPAGAFFVMYLVICLTVSRVRAEFGSPVHDLHFADPGYLMTQLFGSQAFGAPTLTMFSLFFWFNRAQRSHPMPVLLEGLVATGRSGAARRRMAVILLIAIVAGLASAYWALLEPYYRLGAASGKVAGIQRGFGGQPFSQLASWLRQPTQPNHGAAAFMTGGFLLTLFLYFLRTRFIGFALHPVGYAISGTWSMELIWFSLLLAWLCKVSIMRYGGHKVYRQAVPFFLGLVLGDFISGAVWNILGCIRGWPIYHFLG